MEGAKIVVVSGSIWCHQRHPSWGFELKNVVCYHSIPDESGSNLVRTSRWVRISSGQSSDTFQSKTSVAQRSLPVLTPLFISWQNGRDRIVVSTSRCGRDNPGSNPGHGRKSIKLCLYHGMSAAFLIRLPPDQGDHIPLRPESQTLTGRHWDIPIICQYGYYF